MHALRIVLFNIVRACDNNMTYEKSHEVDIEVLGSGGQSWNHRIRILLIPLDAYYVRILCSHLISVTFKYNENSFPICLQQKPLK